MTDLHERLHEGLHKGSCEGVGGGLYEGINGGQGYILVDLVEKAPSDAIPEQSLGSCECCGWCWLCHILARITWGCCCACAEVLNI